MDSVLGSFFSRSRTIGLNIKYKIPAIKIGVNRVDANTMIGSKRKDTFVDT